MTEQDDRLWARGNEQAASPVGAARPDDAARPGAPANGAVPARRWDAAPGNLESAAHDPVAPDPPPRRVPRAMGIAPERPAPPRGAVGRRRRAGWVVAGAAVGLAGAAIAVALIAGRGAERPGGDRLPRAGAADRARRLRRAGLGRRTGGGGRLGARRGDREARRPPLHVGGRPARLALEPRFAWIADTERSAVIRVSTSDRGARRSTRTGPDIADVTVAAGAVWTASSADGTVRVLDGRRKPLVLRVGTRPIALAGRRAACRGPGRRRLAVPARRDHAAPARCADRPRRRSGRRGASRRRRLGRGRPRRDGARRRGRRGRPRPAGRGRRDARRDRRRRRRRLRGRQAAIARW